MGRIHVLPQTLVERIAAGEVIERPASVVKETVENAIDAAATQIDVEIEEGGKKLIRVSDDGVGMDADDLALAFRSHATSKLSQLEDLFEVQTMGFRGEALSSIAAVSHLKAISRTAEEDAGSEIAIDGGAASEAKATPAAKGTVLEIANLFFNLPVRRKFLRSDATESGHVTDAVMRLAFAHPEIGFRLIRNKREMLNARRVDKLKERIGDLLGHDIADQLIETSFDDGYIKVRAFVSPPDLTRSNPRQQFAFLNRRFIRDRLVQHAIAGAYADYVPRGRFPVVFVYLGLAPSEVDVNVHPTKMEVRFRSSGAIHQAIAAAVREALESKDVTGTLAVPTAGGAPAFSEGLRQSARQAVADFFASPPAEPSGAPRADVFETPAPVRHESAAGVQEALPRMRAEDGADPLSAVQIHDSYIVVETPEGFTVIDQHALHERILYEQLKAKTSSGPPASQRLLVPVRLELSRIEKTALDEHRDLLASAGFEIGDFGEGHAAVYAYPSILGNADIAALVSDMVGELTEEDTPNGAARADRLDAILHLVACHAAVKAGDRLCEEEIRSLIEHRSVAQNPYTCPHGRPAALTFSLDDLKKQFRRT